MPKPGQSRLGVSHSCVYQGLGLLHKVTDKLGRGSRMESPWPPMAGRNLIYLPEETEAKVGVQGVHAASVLGCCLRKANVCLPSLSLKWSKRVLDTSGCRGSQIESLPCRGGTVRRRERRWGAQASFPTPAQGIATSQAWDTLPASPLPQPVPLLPTVLSPQVIPLSQCHHLHFT